MSVNLWLRGGLGNQLFQYAFGLFISRKFDLPLEIHTRLLPNTPDEYRGVGRWPQQIGDFGHSGKLHTGKFQLPGKTDLISKLHTSLGHLLDSHPVILAQLGYAGGQQDKDWDLLIEKLSKRQNIYLSGYFIEKRPALALRSTLVPQILGLDSGPLKPIPDKSRKQNSNVEFLAVHVRLGDNLTMQPELLQHYLEYFREAMNLANKMHGAQKIKLFSDQPDLALKLITSFVGENEIITAPKASPLATLRDMATCNGLIATPSTFAWWGAFLQTDQSRVFMGSPWSPKKDFDSSMIFPDSWTLVPKKF